MPLKDKIAVITGASQGLGKAIAESLGKRGAVCAICSNGKEGILSAEKELLGQNLRAKAYEVDVAKMGEVAKFVKAVMEEYGRIDILVNNAGWSGTKKPLEETPEEEYRKTMATNADSVFYFLHEVVPVMRAQGSGKIINIASGAAKRGHGKLAAYSASKFAVLGFTQSVAWELEGSGIDCFAVCPAGINTKMRSEMFGEEDASRQQSPGSVAEIIADAIEGKTKVPNGGDIFVKGGVVVGTSDPLGQ